MAGVEERAPQVCLEPKAGAGVIVAVLCTGHPAPFPMDPSQRSHNPTEGVWMGGASLRLLHSLWIHSMLSEQLPPARRGCVDAGFELEVAGLPFGNAVPAIGLPAPAGGGAKGSTCFPSVFPSLFPVVVLAPAVAGFGPSSPVAQRSSRSPGLVFQQHYFGLLPQPLGSRD